MAISAIISRGKATEKESVDAELTLPSLVPTDMFSLSTAVSGREQHKTLYPLNQSIVSDFFSVTSGIYSYLVSTSVTTKDLCCMHGTNYGDLLRRYT